MDDQDYRVLTEKIGELTLQNKQLRRANLNKDEKIKQLRRVIARIKADAKRKQRKSKD